MVAHRGLPDGQEETERGQGKVGREEVAVETGYRNEQTGQNIDPSVLFKLHRNAWLTRLTGRAAGWTATFIGFLHMNSPLSAQMTLDKSGPTVSHPKRYFIRTRIARLLRGRAVPTVPYIRLLSLTVMVVLA